MMIKFADSNRYFYIFYIFILIIYFNHGISTERVGYLHFNFLCYRNPGHLDVAGYACDSLPSKNCDPSFKICISHQRVETFSKENCPIYFHETNAYDNAESVCNGQFDNRGSMQNLIQKELSYVANTYFVTISITDDDSWTSAITYIATFGAKYKPDPAKDKKSPIYHEINMYRLDRRYSNNKANIKISMAVQCDYERYGKNCEIFCRHSNTYKCSSEGKKICTEGWKGDECLERDLCVYKPCIAGARCFVHNNNAECMCNGKYGPQCEPNYDPCKSNPCVNGGQCIPNKTGETEVRCTCNRPFYGPKCENKFDLCELDPCNNNATCEYDENNKRRCICLSGFAGKMCDQNINPPDASTIFNRTFNWANYSYEAYANKNIYNMQTAQTGTILSILFGIVICFIVAIIAITLLLKIKRKKSHMENLPKITMMDLENKLNPQRPISNDYFVKPPEEFVYDTVREETTYAYLQEQNDDYLIPSRPTTPGFPTTPVNNDDSDYLDMSNSFETFKLMPEIKISEKEPELPPLPTREIKRKLSLSKFCLS